MVPDWIPLTPLDESVPPVPIGEAKLYAPDGVRENNCKAAAEAC